MIQIYSGKEILEMSLDSKPYLIHPILPGEGNVLFHGSAGVGKSTMMWQLANCVATGTDFLGMKAVKGNVLFVSLDMPLWALQQRWSKCQFEAKFDVAVGTPFECLAPGFHLGETYVKLKQAYIEKKYKLIVVDSLGRVCITHSMSDDTVPKQIYPFFNNWFPHTTILFIHHDKKHTLLPTGQYARPTEEDATGSKYWINDAITTLHLWRVNKSIVKLEQGKSQAGETLNETIGEPIELFMDDTGTRMEIWGEHKQKSEASALILAEQQLRKEHEKWDTYPITKRVKYLSEMCGKSIPTINRWRKSLENNRELV